MKKNTYKQIYSQVSTQKVFFIIHKPNEKKLYFYPGLQHKKRAIVGFQAECVGYRGPAEDQTLLEELL